LLLLLQGRCLLLPLLPLLLLLLLVLRLLHTCKALRLVV
jgi:hypothetical protein